MTGRSEFELTDGRHIRLVALDQSLTYEGLLEGLPTVEMNRRLLERLDKADPARWPGIAHLMLPPVETPIPWDDKRPYPFGTPSQLPGITCIGRLRSRAPARTGDYSELILIWFQDAFALPIDPRVVDLVHQIDWAAEATDLEY